MEWFIWLALVIAIILGLLGAGAALLAYFATIKRKDKMIAPQPPPLEQRVTNLELWVHRYAPFIRTDPVPAPPLTHGEGGDRFSWEDIS